MANYLGEDRLEKHYTTDELIEELKSLQKRFYPQATSFLETSAGDGRLIDAFKDIIPDYIAYDIENETKRDDIKECNYMKEKIEYKKDRVCLQNPPFAKGIKFIYKALEECDYCISILSVNSFLNIDYSKYWVDEIQIWRKVQFEKTKVSICIVAIRKRKDGDVYEWE